ncbi:MAG TPA: 50S ribosomal protein L15 [Candidatus Paceibacterota bacterium]|jgi:large subunit ribosomal protein L15|nr:50S ribosomal protein L15 [Candidatus Paceibacterota bacterium]
MQLHDLKRKTPQKAQKRVGRGGGRGKTSGRGTKGQNARSGHKKRPEIREQLKKIPKLRGRGVNSLLSIQAPLAIVNVSALESMFAAGDTVSPATLRERGLVRARKGSTPVVKILGDGELSKKLTISGCAVSGSAREKIEKAGGSVQ